MSDKKDAKGQEFEVKELDDELEDVGGGVCSGCDSCATCGGTGCGGCGTILEADAIGQE